MCAGGRTSVLQPTVKLIYGVIFQHLGEENIQTH